MTDPAGEIISQLRDRARAQHSSESFYDTEHGAPAPYVSGRPMTPPDSESMFAELPTTNDFIDRFGRNRLRHEPQFDLKRGQANRQRQRLRPRGLPFGSLGKVLLLGPFCLLGLALSQALQTMAAFFSSSSLSDRWQLHTTGDGTIRIGLFMLLCSVAVIVGLVIVACKLFGSAGQSNPEEEQHYVPPQYMAQHRQALSLFAQPLTAGSLPLGHRMEWRSGKNGKNGLPQICLPAKLRERRANVLIVGSSACGKTRLMARMIAHDIESNDRAVVIIDSDGELSRLINLWLSTHKNGEQLSARLTVIDPTSAQESVGFNPLQEPKDGDLQAAASAIVYGFKAIYREPPGAQSQWNAQTANILRNCAMLLTINGKTLADLPLLLSDNDFRDLLLEAVENKRSTRSEYSALLDTWGQYKRLARTDSWIAWVEPILNRVAPMLSDSRVRKILTNSENDLDLADVIKRKRVLLIKLPKGRLDQNGNLLGSLIVTGLKQAALLLSTETDCRQNPAVLYLDEFDRFIDKETLESFSGESDRFKIGFIGATRTLQNLPEDFRNSLLIGVGLIAGFSLSKRDADLVGPMMFRIDGRKLPQQSMSDFFNPIKARPAFESISDEEKLNIDRLVGQEAGTFYCYQVGTMAGVFHLRAHPFGD